MSKYISGYKELSDDLLLTNKVIRNTYILLSLVLLFSSFTAWFSVVTKAHVGFYNIFIVIILHYLISIFRKNSYSIILLFLYTGLLGYISGPLLNSILNLANGQQIIFLSFFLTSSLFILLSVYTLFTRKKFNYLASFIFISFFLIFSLIIINLFLNIPLITLFISFFVIIFSCAYILYTTSELIHGGERNYIFATISLYLDIYNIFFSLLRIFSRD